MMTTHSLLFGERSLTTVAALFGQAQDARDAAEHVVRDAHLPEKRVKVLGPGVPGVERKLEPEEAGIVHTLIKTHVALGIIGLIVGLLGGGALVLGGVGWAAASPYMTVSVAAAFGAVGGMMLGGLVSMRPDRALLDTKVEEAVEEGRWAVVVHPVDHDEEERALDVLEHTSGEVVHTL
ncbi:MAG: riboflavin biosynthesis protein RibA [Gammaproteobacteria bacterium]|nr:riboflavin biosynthesis protein RibA [Gammaproteobacteria bacterium]MBU1406863.1 riboflavin biosynthesis protein RibA [Gammaproteobacteria bacterium]MBU1533006.1 riboflavin biosynthesis protein RibA [Gammaproteobacteria bacterium]